MRTTALRFVGGKWTKVTAESVMENKMIGEMFRDADDPDIYLRHHGGLLTPHFEIEPRWPYARRAA